MIFLIIDSDGEISLVLCDKRFDCAYSSFEKLSLRAWSS